MGLGRELWCPQDCNLAGVATFSVFNLETYSRLFTELLYQCCIELISEKRYWIGVVLNLLVKRGIG
jgi:hypothetical protein